MRRRVERARLRLMRAAAALAAVFASFITMYAVCRWCGAQISPAILAAILAITLSRRPNAAPIGRLLTAPAVIASTALAATGVGWLLKAIPLLGAAVFVAAMFGSIWLRNFGERGRSIGALIALPLVTMLVVPARAAAPGGALVDFALIVCAGVVPLAYVTAIQWTAARAGMSLAADAPERTEMKRKHNGLSVPTRMALQMTIALMAAFVVGFLVFPAHWGWTVLTAFIVCSGIRGRGDAVYKGVLRLLGACVGTLAAAGLAYLWTPSGPAEAAAIFMLLFLGLLLRETNYAYWAGFVTLILAVLTSSSSGLNSMLLGLRLEAIFCGAACAVATAWFVLPIRTEAVIRRRLADALSALDEVIVHAALPDAEQTNRHALLEYRIAELVQVAPPVRWHLRFSGLRAGREHPARWIELTERLHEHANAFMSDGRGSERQRGLVRRAIGAARRAVASHGKPDVPAGTLPVSVSLNDVRDALKNYDRT